jgi:hypothetical protein|tara:strand:+ start:47845 stop:48114 length:270 start_codon:yes stop_codon:yes gene_type:complete
MKKNDVVTVICGVGEFIGKFVENTEAGLEIEDPRMLVQGEKGMGFAKGIAITGIQDPPSVIFKNYVFVTPTNDDVMKGYRQATSGIVLA